MFRLSDRFPIVALLLSVLVPLAQAHDLEIFATVADGVVQGNVSYEDNPAKGITITVLGPDGEILGTTESEEDGTFSWLPATDSDLRFVAETVDGHREEFTIEAGELPHVHSVSKVPSSLSDGSDRSDRSVRSMGEAIPADLQQIVEDAVSRQIRPLREQLDAAEHRTQLRDVVGGVGYIVGIAGLFALWKSRSKSTGG